MKFDKSDVIIVLGRGIYPDGTLPNVAKYRSEKAAELFKKKLAKKVIISAGYWGFLRFVPPTTEARPMREIIVGKGVPNSKIILEETSRDTIGNAYFTRLIVDKNKWKKIIVVTSKDHYARTKYYFDKVYGSDYDIQYSLAKTDFSKKELSRILFFEKIILRFVGLKRINSGDLKSVKEYIFKKHIMYSGSFWRKLISFFVKQPYLKNKD